MSRFDFLTDPEFRQSMEADYGELDRCLEAQAWKAAHVLSGAIIEALLVDFLVSLGADRSTTGDPLKMSLDQLITAARAEGVLSEKAADLSSAVKQYRNLIHPGRTRRLSEVVDEDGARIAQSLVNVVIKEIVRKQQAEYGYTAERLLTKLEQDSSSRAIVSHLLQETNERERERLLLDVVPRRHFELLDAGDTSRPLLHSHEVLFHAALEGASPAVKQKVAAEAIRIIKEETAERVLAYEDAFIRVRDMDEFDAQQQVLLKQHLLARLRERPSAQLFRTLGGIGPYLSADDARSVASGVARLVVTQPDEFVTGLATSFLASEFPNVSAAATTSIWDELEKMRTRLAGAGGVTGAQRVQELSDSLIPF